MLYLCVWWQMTDSSLYLSLMESVLTGSVYRDPGHEKAYDDNERWCGGDWPKTAHTMIGRKRLHQLRLACEHVIDRKIPGNLMECGVWRGGAAIMMKAVLVSRNAYDRRVILADSFEGLPKAEWPEDKLFEMTDGDKSFLKVSADEVVDNFQAYGLMDSGVTFIPGWFHETLPQYKDKLNLALLRVDGDFYKSTWEVLENCYSSINKGGICIVDDYGAMIECRRAVDRFIEERKLIVEMNKIDWSGVWWEVHH